MCHLLDIIVGDHQTEGALLYIKPRRQNPAGFFIGLINKFMKIQELFTVTESWKTKTKTKTQDPFADWFDTETDEKGRTTHVPVKSKSRRSPQRQQATPQQTRQRTANVQMPDGAGEKFAAINNLNMQDELSDDDAAANVDTEYNQPEPQEPTNIPARISKAIAAEGSVEPEWHQVRNLPGYLKNGIRAMGRQVFGTFTDTPIEDIEVLANLNNSGPNEPRELNAVAGWLKNNATRYTDGEMNFQQSIPDYNAEYAMYTTEDQTFLLVNDFAGNYVYSWPTSDEKSTQQRTSLDQPRRRLR